MRLVYYPVLVAIFLLGISCTSGKIEIKGDAEAVQKAQAMIDSLGGSEKWSSVKSVYIRTVNMDASRDGNYMLEEWINLDEPLFMNRETTENYSVTRILNKNDGWIIRNGKVDLLSGDAISGLIRWHKFFLMNALKKLAEGGENMEVRIDREQLIIYENGKFYAGFIIGKNGLPEKYITPGTGDRMSEVNIPLWGEYKGYRYPLEVNSSNRLVLYKTDYFDPSTVDAAKAFKVIFDPYQLAERMNN